MGHTLRKLATSEYTTLGRTLILTPEQPNYYVIDVDYDSYAIVYNCDLEKEGQQILYYLTREAGISQELYDYIDARAHALLPNFDWSTLNHRTYRGDKCTYMGAESFLQ